MTVPLTIRTATQADDWIARGTSPQAPCWWRGRAGLAAQEILNEQQIGGRDDE
jgi:hypothetical protein